MKPQMSEFSCKGTVRVCAHNVEFSYWGNIPNELLFSNALKELLEEAAESRAKEMITENYSSGELNYETDEFQLRGWWEINKS